jgi:hypothetical protein
LAFSENTVAELISAITALQKGFPGGFSRTNRRFRMRQTIKVGYGQKWGGSELYTRTEHPHPA